MTVIPLFHFTCEHSAARIERTGFLEPRPQPVLDRRSLLWLSVSAAVEPAALGLGTTHLIRCDRTAYRFVVSSRGAVPWSVYRRSVPVEQVRMLEAARGTRPGLWWVSEQPLPIEVIR